MKKLLLFLTVLFLWTGSSWGQISIGTGVSNSSIPINPYYGYSYSQMLYLQSEIMASGNITRLEFYFSGTSLSNSNNWTIYMGHTSKTAFSGGTDWIPVASLTQVYSATFTNPSESGWISFDITDFAYNNTDNLVIAVDENAMSYNTSSDYFYSAASTTGRSIRYYSDGTNPDPASPPTGTLVSAYANVILGGLTVSSPPNCATITSPTDAATDIQKSATLNWASGGGAPTGYKLYFGTDNPPTNIVNGTDLGDVTTYDPSPDMDYSTTYYWKVVPYNANGDATGCSVWSFETEADPTLTPPFTEAFDPYPPTNWEEAAGLLAAPVVFSSTTSSTWTADGFANVGSTGAARVEIWSTSTDEWLITPPINLGDGSIDYRLTFDLAITYYSNTNPPATTGTDDKFAVVISTDNGATWTSVNTLMLWDNAGSENVYNDISNTGENITIDLAAYSGIVKLGFYGESTISNADNNVYVDNVTVEEIPSVPVCTIDPTSKDFGYAVAGGDPTAAQTFTISNTGISTLTITEGGISLTGTNPGDFSLSSVTYPINLTAGQSTTVDIAFAPVSAGSKSANLHVVHNASGSPTDVALSGTALPEGSLFESFEGTTFPPAGWSKDASSWTQYSAAYDGTKCAYLYNYGTVTDKKLMTPKVTLSGSESLTFYGKNSSGSNQKIQIKYSEDKSSWTNIGDEIILTSTFTEYSVDLSSIAAGNYYLAFSANSAYAYGNYFYIDYVIGPVIFQEAPGPATIGTPTDADTDISINTTLSWTSGSTGGIPSGYYLYFGTDGEGTSTPTNLENGTEQTSPYTPGSSLSYSTTYYWQIVPHNSVGNASGCPIWSFETEADPTLTPPFTQTFDTYPPTNWGEATGLLAAPVVFSSTTISNWTGDGFAHVGTTGAARVNIFGAGTDEWMLTPPINLGNGSTTYRLTFDLALTAYNSTGAAQTTGVDDKFAVVISADNGATWTSANTLMLWDNAGSANVYNNIATAGENIVIDLAAYTGIVQIGFYGESTVSNADNDLFVDNVTVESYSDATLSWYNLQWPGTGEITEAENLTVYSQCWEDGVTGQGTGGGVGIQCWIGYSSDNTNPNTWTNWVEATYNQDVGNNDEYMADLGADQGLTAGTYYYASRYSYLGGPYTYGGYTSTGGGSWDGTTNVSGVLTVNSVVISSFPWNEGFEHDGVMPAGWSQVYESGTHNWVYQNGGTSSNPAAAHTGSYNAAYIHSVRGDVTKLVSPSIDLSILTTPVLTFWHAQSEWSGDQDELRVYYKTSAAGSWTLIPNAEWTSNISDWTQSAFILPNPGNDYYIAFEATDDYGYGVVVDDVSVSELSSTTWTGASDNDWHTIANWNLGVPTSSINVIIPADLTNYPTIASAASCNNLTIESSATGTGSLLGQNYLTVNGTTTIERYATAGTWHGISGPLDNDDFNSLYFGGNPDVWGMSYDESDNEYDYVTDLNTDLGDAKGWMVWIGGSTAQTFEFTGDLRKSAVGPVALTNTLTDPDYGYNFIGNPYPSTIDWDVIEATLTNVGSGIWVWNPNAAGGPDFATYITGGSSTNGGSKDIALGQGFFVQLAQTEATGSITIPLTSQEHASSGFMKNQQILPSNYIKLKLTDAYRTDESIIRLDAQATEGYDLKYDMHKLFSWDEEQPQLYSTDNNFMAINALPPSTVSVPMDVRGVDGNEMTISLEAVSDFDHVYLSDDFTGVQTELTEQPYTFVYDASQTDRFTVYFTIVSTTENMLENIRVYSFDKQINMEIPMEFDGHVEVVNMLGQTVREMDVHMGTHVFHLDHIGYYLVKITGDNHQVTRKVFIK